MNLLSSYLGVRQSRQEYRGKNRNDRDYDQQLDQGKTADDGGNKHVVLSRLHNKSSTPGSFKTIGIIHFRFFSMVAFWRSSQCISRLHIQFNSSQENGRSLNGPGRLIFFRVFTRLPMLV